jgi:phage baseplate assembly protein W
MANPTRTFSDMDLSFRPHPMTGDLMAKYDENAIKTSIKNLIMTNHFERPFHSEIGSGVAGMLFELATPATAVLLRESIRNVINNFEPRVIVDDVNTAFSADELTVNITLTFRIINTSTPINVQFALRRTM